ncbi:uncharacterized protein (TIGR03580 family) [Virgibacillus halotolerans]|uniref:DUF4311 domain-containing protein n=1 Tax=Virgibacillus halotolerans TaxID=1071053 RepID=UPI00196173BD|nr:DUF4311 domain-containing protein [Virgibacillus halotolerans]MBM7599027.1 uncharacterized protein (TIGR03580 family) [Virgibacillus halotolerans]
MTIWVLIKSLIIGGLVGFGIGAGAARMYHIPKTQGMGAFRTLGELNACQGDPASHFSFGLGVFFNAWANAVAGGALTGDVGHRIIPNWAAAILLLKGKDPETTLHNPRKMAITGSIVGAFVVAFLNVTAASIPKSLQDVANEVLIPAADWFLNPVMPAIFLLAAIDGGRRTGIYGTLFGGLAHLVMGNAVPGIVLGILIGKGVDDTGWSKMSKIIFTAVVLLFILSGFFRGFDIEMIESLNMTVPNWLIGIHEIFGYEVK